MNIKQVALDSDKVMWSKSTIQDAVAETVCPQTTPSTKSMQ